MMEQTHFKHFNENDTYIRPENFSMVDDLLDWQRVPQSPAPGEDSNTLKT
jgi:hypothetical protein